MSNTLSKRGQDVASVFRRALPLIDATLRQEFRVPAEYAAEVEQDVYLWFTRFTVRPGKPQSIEGLRVNLFWATCMAAQEYWLSRLDGAIPDEQVGRALTREPREMAKELDEKLREIEKKSETEEKEERSDS